MLLSIFNIKWLLRPRSRLRVASKGIQAITRVIYRASRGLSTLALFYIVPVPPCLYCRSVLILVDLPVSFPASLRH